MSSEPFHVSLDPPLDITGSLALFQRPGDDLIDRWDGQHLRRVIQLGTHDVPFAARATGTLDHPAFEVAVGPEISAADRALVRDTVAATFTPRPASYAALLASDPVLASLDRQLPGIRQIRQLDLFTALVRCISAQQVNLRWATTTRRRLAETFGTRHTIGEAVVYSLDPARLATVDPAQLRALQFTTSKAVSIVAVAQTLVAEHLTSTSLAQLDDADVIASLTRIRGIGRWSADWVLARTLGRPCVVAGDLGVRKAIGLAYGLSTLPAEADVRELGARWGEAAGVAQALLLHALGEGVLSPARRESRPASR